MAPVGMTAISSRGPPEPRRMTEPLPNCRSICEIASSSACRRSFFASAMRLSFNHPRTLAAPCVIAFGHSRWAPAWASMSGNSDTSPDITAKAHGGQLGITGPAGGELTAHERGARHADPAKFALRAVPQGLGERLASPGLAHPAEGDVRRERPPLAGEAERRERSVDAAGQLDHGVAAFRHARPDDPRARGRRESAEPSQLGVEDPRIRGRPLESVDDGADPTLGDLTEELQREVKIPGSHPGDVARRGAKPLDRLPEPSLDGVAEQDRDERADAGYRRGSSSSSRLRMPCRRSRSVSAASAARRSAIAPTRSPLSSLSRPRAASARASSGRGAGSAGLGTAAIAGAWVGPDAGGDAAAGGVSAGDGTGAVTAGAGSGVGTGAATAGDVTDAGGAAAGDTGAGPGAVAGAGRGAGSAGDVADAPGVGVGAGAGGGGSATGAATTGGEVGMGTAGDAPVAGAGAGSGAGGARAGAGTATTGGATGVAAAGVGGVVERPGPAVTGGMAPTAASMSAFSPGSGSSSIARDQSAWARSRSPASDRAVPRAKRALA